MEVSIKPQTKYKITECNIEVSYSNGTTKNITLEEFETSQSWKETTDPGFVSAEIIDYKVDYGSDIFLEVLCWLAFVGSLVSALILFKKRI